MIAVQLQLDLRHQVLFFLFFSFRTDVISVSCYLDVYDKFDGRNFWEGLYTYV